MTEKSESLSVTITGKNSEIQQQELIINSLNMTIAEQQQTIETSNLFSINTLYTTRQDLLAEAATGNNVEKELKKIDAEIAEKEKINNAEKIKVENAKNTIIGLERKRAEAVKNIEGLKEELSPVIGEYLQQQAEALAIEYNDIGGKLAGVYQRIKALSQLISTINSGAATGLMGTYSYMLVIPALPAPNASDNFIFRDEDFNFPEQVGIEKANLAKQGITI